MLLCWGRLYLKFLLQEVIVLRQRIHKIFVVFLAMLFLLAGCSSGDQSGQQVEQMDLAPTIGHKDVSNDTGELKVHFIDVGQGDSILIETPGGQNMLIDAGERDQGEKVVNYIKSQGVDKLHFVVGTHPHSDHIGGLVKVIESIPVEKIYLPRVTHTSRSFENLLEAISNKGLKISTAAAGVKISLADGEASFIAPVGEDYEGLNNYSAVIKLTYGSASFLFTGDAEKLSEKEMLANGTDLKADVLKVGHHGSVSSTSSNFLQAVSPEYAVIMCGSGNDYGHPHKETLAALSGLEVYRTDSDGTIIISTDGNNYNITTGNKIAAQDKVVSNKDNSVYYIGNKNSKKFHRTDCANLPAENNRVYFATCEEAVNQGYTPCGSCNP